MNHPDPKKHQLISFVKSAIRIGSSIGIATLAIAGIGTALGLVTGLAIGYGLAEAVGVWEELV